MKYRVVGWTTYDGPEVKRADCSEAAMQAILRDIREHHYEFTGWDHQELPLCAPVLNDGCKRLFSQRGFGHVMAWAHGDYSRGGYVNYAFTDFGESPTTCYPDESRRFDPATFQPEQDLAEHFCYEVDAQTIELARTEGEIKLPDDPALLMIDEGDTITLTAGDRRVEFDVLFSERGRDLTEEQELDLYALTLTCDFDKMQEADRRYEQAAWMLFLSLKERNA